MSLPNFSRVKILTDKFQNRGVYAGDVGYIIEVYDENNYEVEVSDANGITIALFAAKTDEIQLLPESDTEQERGSATPPL